MDKFLTIPDLVEKCDERSTILYKLGPDTPISYWGMAMMGEGGELCNLLAKLERAKLGGADGGNSLKTEDITKEKLAEEMGGLVIYLAILSKRIGISLEDAIIKTFNDKSLKMGYPIMLEKNNQIAQSHDDKLTAHVKLLIRNFESLEHALTPYGQGGLNALRKVMEGATSNDGVNWTNIKK
ncbi:MAG TPA: hypothetical protein VEA37_05430 [Flavobacterium sp.]|nr:hypothetical protein [Flavobacterium sp.]